MAAAIEPTTTAMPMMLAPTLRPDPPRVATSFMLPPGSRVDPWSPHGRPRCPPWSGWTRSSGVARGDRALGRRRPLAPRSRVKARQRQAGDRHGEDVVAGRDTGAAL